MRVDTCGQRATKKGVAGGAALKNGRLWTAQRPKMGLTCPRLSTRTFVWTRAKVLRRIDFYREMSTVHSYISFLHTDGQEGRYPCCIREWLKCVDSGHATSCLRRSAAAVASSSSGRPLRVFAACRTPAGRWSIVAPCCRDLSGRMGVRRIAVFDEPAADEPWLKPTAGDPWLKVIKLKAIKAEG